MSRVDGYLIDELRFRNLRHVVKRLYSEETFKPDEMRDLAQFLDCVVDDAVHLEDIPEDAVTRAKVEEGPY